MIGLKDFREIYKKVEAETTITSESTKAEILRAKVIMGAKTKEGYLEIEKELKEFMESDAPQDEKDMVAQYTCPFYMVLGAIKEGRV